MNPISCFLMALFSISAYTAKSQLSTDEIALNNLHKKTEAERVKLGRLNKTYFDKVNNTKDSLERKVYQNRIDSIEKLAELNAEKELLIDLNFVQHHRSAPISIFLLQYRLSRKEGLKYYSRINELYNSLNVKLKTTADGIKLKESLFDFKNSSVGNIAPDFTVRDINNKELVLSSFRNNKYILLDFWASWCVPCRQDFPMMKELYRRYHSQNFEIINISRDENLNFWRNAIEHDSISIWRHFSIKQNKQPIEKLFSVTAIPVKILINKEGIIIGRWVGDGEENFAEIKQSLEEIIR